jgi:hypothetical protein
MIDLWLAPMRTMAAMQRQALVLMPPPPMAAVTFPGDLVLAANPLAAWLPLMRVAAGMAPSPWLAVGLRLPVGTCGVVTLGMRP